MARPLPKHGERACYLRGCRRPECCDANYRYMARIRLERERGQRRRTEAQPVADRVAELVAAGWTQAQIERATGVGHRTLSPLLSGQYPRVHATTARKILALPVGPPPADQLDTSAIGSTRRLRALVAIGYTYPAIAPAVGIHRDVIGVIARGERANVRVETAQAVARAYKKLSRTPGPSMQARDQAARLGWHGPLAWDDIDDPSAVPEVDKATRGSGPRHGESPDPARVMRLTNEGLSAAQIAMRLGVHKRTVVRARGKARAGAGAEQVAA